MENNIESTMQRTRQYWFIDGLAEISTGAIFLAIGVLFYLDASGNAPFKGLSAIGLPVIILVGILISRWMIRDLKARITYPRSGYVGYAERRRLPRWATILLGAGMGILIGALILLVPESMTWVPAFDGLIVLAVFLYIGHTMGLWRFYALAAFSGVLGVTLSLVGVGETLGTAILFALTGLALMVAGGLTLFLYIRNTEPIQQDKEET